MYLRNTFILFLILLSILLSMPACSSNRDETNPPASDYKGVDLPPIPDPERGNPKLDPKLQDLIEAEKRGELESWARQRSITLVDGRVHVTINCVPGQIEAATRAATDAGARQVGEIPYFENEIGALVPITSLTALASEESIISIKLPPPATPG